MLTKLHVYEVCFGLSSRNTALLRILGDKVRFSQYKANIFRSSILLFTYYSTNKLFLRFHKISKYINFCNKFKINYTCYTCFTSKENTINMAFCIHIRIIEHLVVVAVPVAMSNIPLIYLHCRVDGTASRCCSVWYIV